MSSEDKFSRYWHKETPDRLVNKGDPNAVTQCPNCGVCYRNGERVEKPAKSWLRIVVENWWRYGWRITVDYGSTMPLGYGVSWQEVNRPALVMHPIPVNVIVRALREVGLWLVRGGWKKYPSVQDRIDAKAVERCDIMTRHLREELRIANVHLESAWRQAREMQERLAEREKAED